MKIKYIILVAVLLCSAGYFFLKKNDQSLDRKDCLVVGIAADYAPYVSINQQGEYEGFDVDIAHALAKKMNKKLVFKDYGSMTSLFMALDQNAIDIILWGISITQKRLEKVDFVPYHGQEIMSYPLVFWQDIPHKIVTLSDMKGARICVEPNSVQSAVLYPYEDTITIIPTERVDDAFLMVQQGKADAALLDPAIAQKFKIKCPQIKSIEIVLSPEERSYGMGIPVNKTNIDLKKVLDNAVEALKQEGVIKDLEKKWGVL